MYNEYIECLPAVNKGCCCIMNVFRKGMLNMKYRHIDKLGIDVSAFGLGCMRFPMTKDEKGNDVVDEKISTEIIRACIDGGVNYIDTAYVYSGGLNEKYVGLALRDGYREKVFLATKLPVWECNSKEYMYEKFEEQCQRLGTDYIDFYLVHCLTKDKWLKVKELGICDFLDDLKAKGRIKYACFSFHDNYEAFETILCGYDWDMCQLQFNYMDVNNQAGEKGVRLAGKRGVPVVIMEGLLGGKLANVPSDVKAHFEKANPDRSPVEWAFRWLCDYPEVATVLSGVTNMEQAKDNLAIFDRCEKNSLSEEEKRVVSEAREIYKKRIKVDCTGCEYCMPCPMDVEIPKIFAKWNYSYMYEINDEGYKKLVEEKKDASRCVECRACMDKCPQGFDIPQKLKEAHEYFGF